MMFSLPRYEVRYSNEEEWIEITEIELMDRLYKLYHQVTPAIKEMLTGKELHTQHADYRLKWQFGSHRMAKVNHH